MLNPTDDRPPLNVPNWTTCIDEEAHIEMGAHTTMATTQPDRMNTKAGKLYVE
jgi:hypothetical protein